MTLAVREAGYLAGKSVRPPGQPSPLLDDGHLQCRVRLYNDISMGAGTLVVDIVLIVNNRPDPSHFERDISKTEIDVHVFNGLRGNSKGMQMGKYLHSD